MSRSPRAVTAAVTGLASRIRMASSMSTRGGISVFSRHPIIAGQPFRSRRSYREHLASQSQYSSVSSRQADDDDDDDDDLFMDGDSDYDYESDDESDDDEHQPDHPWKTLLELPSRAGWRASDPRPPDHVVAAQTGVLTAGGATAKQLKRTYVGIVASHKALAERRERERRRLINRTHYSRKAQQKDDEAEPVFYGKMETLAHLRNRLPPNYAITKRVLEEAKSLLGHSLYTTANNTSANNDGWRPKRIIDMGIGVGGASAAALEVFGNDVEWVHGIDPSRCMRECAKEFLEEIMENTTTSTTTPQDEGGSTSSSNPQQQQPRVNPPRLTLSGSISADSAAASTFDMALMTYTATELPGVASNLAAAAILWQKLSPNGVLVMIEPGTPDGFHSIRSVRTMLLDCCPPPGSKDDDDDDNEDMTNEAAGQCHIIAPCTHSGKCPMERYQHDFFKQRNPKTQMDIPSSTTSTTSNDFDFGDVDEDVDNWNDEEWDDAPKASKKAANARGPGMTEDTDFLNRRFCSFVQTMSTGSHLRKGEKFSYLVAQKRVPSAASSSEDNQTIDPASLSSFQNDRLRDLLTSVYHANEMPETDNEEVNDKQRRHVQALFEEAQALEAKYLDSEEDELGLEFLQGDANRASFARIIRAPLKKRGHVMIDYCAAPGRLMRTRVSKALDYTVAPGLFTAARKSRWGGFWPDVATGSLNYFKDESTDGKSDKN